MECGYGEREMKTLTGHDGGWVVVRRGVYVDRIVWESLDEDGRYVLGARAVHACLRQPRVLSHASAAAVLGWPLRPRWRTLQHLTRPDVMGGRTEHGVKHHVGRLGEPDVTEVSGLRVTALARTAVDLARECGFVEGVVACDLALRLGATREELSRVVAGMACWPGITRARAAAQLADGGAANPGESLARLLVLELGIGVPETQFEIRAGAHCAFADLRVGAHLFEFDGKVKYLGREQGGFAGPTPEEALWAEKQREDWLRSLGWGISRIVWDDLFEPRRRTARERLLREYAETVRRWGAAPHTLPAPSGPFPRGITRVDGR